MVMADPTTKPDAAISWGILKAIWEGLPSFKHVTTAVQSDGGVSPCAASVVIGGSLLSLNDWPILAKPGGGVHFWEMYSLLLGAG